MTTTTTTTLSFLLETSFVGYALSLYNSAYYLVINVNQLATICA